MSVLDINPISGRLDLTTKGIGLKIVKTGALIANQTKTVVHGMTYTHYLFLSTDQSGQEVTLQTLKPDSLNPNTAFVIESFEDVADPGLNVFCIGLNEEGFTNASFYTSDTLLENEFSYGYQKNFSQSTTVVTAIGNSVLHATKPLQSKMKRCVLRDDGTVKYWLGENNSNEQEDGQAANTDGTDGQVLTYVPEGYRKETWNGDLKTVRYAEIPLPGFTYYPEFYFGSYEGYVDAEGKLCSVSGKVPTTGKNINVFRTHAENRGERWCLADHETQNIVDDLMTIEVLNLNSQQAVSEGATNASSQDWSDYNSYNPVFETGLTNSLGNVTGEIAQVIANFKNGGTEDLNTQVFSFRGIENLWGHIWEFRDGANILNSSANGSQLFVCNDPDFYASDTIENYKLLGNIAENDGYGKKMMEGSFIPATVGGGSTTYLSDYFSTYFDNNPDVGYRVLLVGGNLSAGSHAGVRYSIVDISSGGASAHFGSRLCYKPKKA